MSEPGRDRIRELLDAVLADVEVGDRLGDMAAAAYTSPFHFSRQVSRAAGEPPVALRRRVLLERAAWRIQRGTSVTDAAFEAGYDSVEGFSRAFARAFGCVPSAMPARGERGHWLPAPNGIHFHSPTVLYVDGGAATEHSAGEVLALMVRHDLDDTDAVLAAAEPLGEPELRRERLAGHEVLSWSGPETTLADVLQHLALDKLPWLASIEGADEPDLAGPHDVATLRARHADVAARWLAMTRDVERRGAWDDRVIDAICDPPESFLLSQIVAHTLTFSAHRRQLARWMLRQAGVDVSVPTLDPDPITWHRRASGGQ
ncbi:helix-turn-helix domain-containing protein [Pseudactinotalea suaedae]|uniref:helix-turn-helix domain-containing protein n=1 Tax=Pseudactinotalea suaedae TaxID=1524924 RepID=UPI001F4F2F96|nr:helix-turn-helix domain-containing protein [Pseudactinotalea suaedae]